MIVIGSRGSKLALWQAQHIGEQLKALGLETRIEVIKTTGDKLQDVPLTQAGGKGVFTKEIDEALLAGSIDLAVHSMKDVPTGLPPGLTIAAIPEREEPRDALIGCSLAELRDEDVSVDDGLGWLLLACQICRDVWDDRSWSLLSARLSA